MIITLILLVLFGLISGGTYYYLNFYNKDNKFSILNYKITDTDVEPEDILLPELVSTDLAGAVVETVNWRGDSRKLILRLKKPDATTVHLFIDIKKPENAFIYEKEFFVTADKFIFDQTNSNNVYVILEQKLYQLNASTKSLSSVLVENSVDVSTNRDKTLISPINFIFMSSKIATCLKSQYSRLQYQTDLLTSNTLK